MIYCLKLGEGIIRELREEEKREIDSLILFGVIIFCGVLVAISQVIIWHGDKLTWF